MGYVPSQLGPWDLVFFFFLNSKMDFIGVPIVTQQVKNPTSIHEDVGLIPGLAQLVKDLALP